MTSVRMRKALQAQETAEAVLVLITITHPDLGAPLRFSSDGVDTVSRGETFVAYPFADEWPEDREDATPEVTLVIDNVDAAIGAALKGIETPAAITLEVVLADTPDTVEYGPLELELIGVEVDQLTVKGRLSGPPVLQQAWPGTIITPGNFPGLFT